MTYYVGLDVSLEETSVCVIDASGAVAAEAKVWSDPGAIADFLAPWSGSIAKVGLEAGSLSPWLFAGLAGRGLPVVCIETRRMKAYAQASPVKTDRRDARLIGLAMRAGLYRAVHVKSEDSQTLRMALSGRQAVLRQARQLQVKIRGDLRPFGVRLGRVGAGGFAAKVKVMLADRPDLWRLVEPLLAVRTAALAEVRRYDADLRRLAKHNDLCRRLMTVPGVGPLTALAFIAGIDDVKRFKRARAVPAVLGLTPRIEQSGERERCGAITKAGDRLLRSLLFEAANALLTRTRRWCALKRWGVSLVKRRGLNRGRVAVARRLAIVLFCLWRDGSEFRWTAKDQPSANTADAAATA